MIINYFKKKNMRKLLTAAVLAVFILGCNPDTEDQNKENTADSIQVEQAEKALENAEEIEKKSEELERKADSLLNSI
jgi:predicted negative regulator of RcsB-dependent stress response